MTALYTKSQGKSAANGIIYLDGATTKKCQRLMYVGSEFVRIPGADIYELERWPKGESAMLEHKRAARKISLRIAQQFEEVAEKNTRAQRKFLGVVLSFAKSERYLENDPQKMDEIVRMWLNGMGYKNSQYLAVYHYDTGAPHVHLYVNLIDYFSHKAVNRYNDEYRSQRVCREIEVKYGLEVGKGISHENSLEAKSELGADRKVIIEAARASFVEGATSENQFIEKMKSKGISVKVVHHAGRDGYSYRVGKHKPHPGFMLSSELTMKNITNQITIALERHKEKHPKINFDFKAAREKMASASVQEKGDFPDIDIFSLMMHATDRNTLERELTSNLTVMTPLLDDYGGVIDFKLKFAKERIKIRLSQILSKERLRKMLVKWEQLSGQVPAFKLEMARNQQAKLADICKKLDIAYPRYAPRVPEGISFRPDGSVKSVSYSNNSGKYNTVQIEDDLIHWNDGTSFNINTGFHYEPQPQQLQEEDQDNEQSFNVRIR